LPEKDTLAGAAFKVGSPPVPKSGGLVELSQDITAITANAKIAVTIQPPR